MLTSQNPNPNEEKPFVLWRPFLAVWTWLVPPTQAHIDRQSRTARFVFLGLMVTLALALVIVALVYGRQWGHAYKSLMSERDAAEAAKYEKEANEYAEANRTMELQDAMAKAYNKAAEAYTEDADNPEAIRVLARILTRAGGPNVATARYLWEKLAKNHQLTDEDFGWRIQALAKSKDDKGASDQIETLLKDAAPTKRVVDTADAVMQRLGRNKELLNLLRDYVKKQPDDYETKLLLAVRLVQLGDDAEKKEGHQIVWEVAARDDAPGLRALEYLDTLKTLTVEEQGKLAERLQQHPEGKEADRIAALRRFAGLPGADKKAIIDKAIADHANASRDALVPLCQWLLDEGQDEKLADFLKSKENLLKVYFDQQANLLDLYLNALTHLQRYDEVERLVSDAHVGMTKSQRAYHRAHLAYVLGKPDEELDKLLVEAVSAAINDNKISMLLELGRYAEQRKHYRTALDAFRAASVNARTEREGFEGLLRVNYLIGDTKEFSQAARETARRWPDNEYYQEVSLYSTLLTGIDMETAIMHCQKFYQARPNDSLRKLIMGLADMRMADVKSCRRALSDIDLDHITAGQRAVLCGLLHAIGQLDHAEGLLKQANDLAQSIPDSLTMLPEEANFLRRAKQSPEVVNALK